MGREAVPEKDLIAGQMGGEEMRVCGRQKGAVEDGGALIRRGSAEQRRDEREEELVCEVVGDQGVVERGATLDEEEVHPTLVLEGPQRLSKVDTAGPVGADREYLAPCMPAGG